MKQKGFTLIELLVVLALIAILATVLIVIINPTRIFQKARDTKRVGDLKTLDQALTAYISENAQTGNIYLSATSSNDRCLNGTATPTIFYSAGNSGAIGVGNFGWAERTSSTAMNGTGWLPVNLSGVTVLNINSLPLDPINQFGSHYYYTYACDVNDLTYEFNARMEINTAASLRDGGNDDSLYEIGTKKTILPASSTGFYQ